MFGENRAMFIPNTRNNVHPEHEKTCPGRRALKSRPAGVAGACWGVDEICINEGESVKCSVVTSNVQGEHDG